MLPCSSRFSGEGLDVGDSLSKDEGVDILKKSVRIDRGRAVDELTYVPS